MLRGEERRKHIRIFLPDGKVRFLTEEYLALIGRTIDISIGGARFYCEMKLDISEVINLEIILPNKVKFKCAAKIMHIERDESQMIYGVCFENLGEKEREDLGNFIVGMRANQDDMLRKKLE
jgi:c-di-GMP-binding flagellar brake protein YcgR